MSKQFEIHLKRFLKPEWHQYIANWLLTATAKESKGVKIISAVIKTDGNRRFRCKSAKGGSAGGTSNLNAVASQLRTMQMRSTYNEHHVTEDRNISSDILKYKRLRDLPCHVVLNPAAFQSIERWLQFDKDVEYKALVLATLRSLHSVVRVQTNINTSTVRTDFKWNSGAEKPRTANGALTRENFNRFSYDSAAPLTPKSALDYGKIYVNKPDYTPAKEMKKRFLKGYGDHITMDLGCIPVAGSSSYANNFITKHQRPNILNCTKARQSSVQAVIPDPHAKTSDAKFFKPNTTAAF